MGYAALRRVLQLFFFIQSYARSGVTGHNAVAWCAGRFLCARFARRGSEIEQRKCGGCESLATAFLGGHHACSLNDIRLIRMHAGTCLALLRVDLFSYI